MELTAQHSDDSFIADYKCGYSSVRSIYQSWRVYSSSNDPFELKIAEAGKWCEYYRNFNSKINAASALMCTLHYVLCSSSSLLWLINAQRSILDAECYHLFLFKNTIYVKAIYVLFCTLYRVSRITFQSYQHWQWASVFWCNNPFILNFSLAKRIPTPELHTMELTPNRNCNCIRCELCKWMIIFL